MSVRNGLLGWVFTVGLAACAAEPGASDPPAQPPAGNAEETHSPATTSPTPPAPVTAHTEGAAPATAPSGGTGLRASVSGLTGNISDLRGLISELGGEVRGQQIHVELPADTLFDFDSAQVIAAGEPNLGKLAQLINKTSGVVQLVGHTDNKGSDSYNQDLSQRRAQSVASWLQANGVAPDRLQASGRGATEPVADNANADGSDNPQGRAKNRRVEAIVPAP